MTHTMRTAAALIVLLLVSLPASAQSPGDRVIVLQNAPIYSVVGAVAPLRVATAGTVLQLVSAANAAWLQVRYQDPNSGLRVGFVSARLVRIENVALTPQDLSVPDAPPARLPPPSPTVRQAPQTLPQDAPPVARRQAPVTVDSPSPGPLTVAPSPRPPLRRDGFWFSAGMGYGALSCDTCIGYADGFSGGLSGGGTVGDHWLLGAGTTGWYRSFEGGWLNASTFDFRARFYPSVSHGFFLTGGIGVGEVRLGVGRLSVSETGGAGVFGLGWDVRVAQNVSVTPFWNGSAISAPDEVVSFGQIGVGFTVH